MSFSIGDLAEISKAATERVAAEYQKYGWQNPPTVTIAMVEAVLEAASHSVQADGGYWRCKNCGRRNDIGTIECAGCG